MILSDIDLQHRVIDAGLISDVEERDLQPASIDLRLGHEFARYIDNGDLAEFDPARGVIVESEKFHVDDHYVLQPGESILGHTKNKVQIPLNLVARVEGKSSLGRIFLFVHVTAGFIDPGFSGDIVLEFYNGSKFPIVLRPGMKIAQLCFLEVSSVVEKPYGHKDLGSHYQNQIGARAAEGQ